MYATSEEDICETKEIQYSMNQIYRLNTPSIRIHSSPILRFRASISVAGDSTMSTNSVRVAADSTMSTNLVRVAAAQMTSITDLAANFTTCSHLVKVFHFLLFQFHNISVIFVLVS